MCFKTNVLFNENKNLNSIFLYASDLLISAVQIYVQLCLLWETRLDFKNKCTALVIHNHLADFTHKI